MNFVSIFSSLSLALFLGLRHGIDWDHIAAITDITGTSKNKKDGFVLGFLYALGHASIIVVFGLAAVFIGIKLPDWVDDFMEPFVGLTLIFLGIWLFYSMFHYGKHFKKKSRWMVIFSLINKISDSIHTKFAHKHNIPHIHIPENYGRKTSFVVGMIHGIGAETPTQLLLFVAAAGATGSTMGILLLLSFVIGLIISNTIITGLATIGFLEVQQNSRLNIILGIISAVFSLIVGFLFLFHRSNFLPDIFGR